MVTCNMSTGPRDRKPAEAVRDNSEEYYRGNSSYLNHNHAPPTTMAFRGHENEQFSLHSNSNANLDEETPMEVSPTVRQAVHLKMNYHDHPEEVHVTLYVKKIIEDSLKIEFDHHSLQVTFKTQDQAFLQNYVTADEQDYFQWQIETFKQISPKKCTHRLKPTNLEIKLIKANFGKWEALESTGSSTTGRTLQREKWISLAPPKTPPRPPTIGHGHDNANEYDEPRSPATASSSPAVPTRIGYTGLGNLGNTCYMNAVLQCLANTTFLRNYFINKSFQRELNMENPLGFKGQLAVAFAIVVRQLWSGQRDSIEPSHLKTLLAKKASQFSGYLQHDAQEFMAFLLDGLHEDLNRVKNKPSTAPVESDGRPDVIVAEEAWRVYKMRNDSVIVDFFQGQYKSTLVCPECDKVSVTFDPFLYLALPLPSSKSCFNVTVFFGYDPAVDSEDGDLSPGAVKLSLWLDPNERVEHLKHEIKQRCAGRLRRQDSEIEVIQVLDGRIRRWLVDQAPLSSLNNTGLDTSLFAFETAPCTGQPQVQIAVIQRLLIPPNDHTHCAACKRESTTLNRCLKCYSVAYCDKNCQKSHWNAVHRSACRIKPYIIGEPFVISLPAASLTYDRLYRTMLHYARFSVDVTLEFSKSSASVRNDSSLNQDMDSSSSLPSTPSPPRRRSTNSGSEDVGAEAAAALESASEGQQQAPRLFFIKPIDSQGQSVTGKKRLEDRGDEMLDLDADESPVFLALDWRNNPQSPDHCVVTPLDDVRCETLDDGERHAGQRDVTLRDCLHQFMQPEVLTREEAWYCPKCKEHREATKQMSLWRLPEILTIQLKRFSFRNLLWRDKIDHKVVFPTQGLDLSPYLSTTVVSGPDAEAVYDLFAVVNHYGSILYGHYTAFARCPANDADNNRENLVGWRCMDDRQVRDVSEESVVTPAAYLLLYMRRKPGSNDAAATTGASGSLPSAGAAGPSGPAPTGFSSVPLKYSDPEEID